MKIKMKMQMKIQKSQILAGLGLIIMGVSFFMPIWWVSLTAPNYPKDTFPDGIRIHFSFTGVSNGCTVKHNEGRAQEIYQGDLGDNPHEERNQSNAQNENGLGKTNGEIGLDCVHEMNTINHYVGMYPIATGAPVELKLSPFVFGLFAVLLMAFLFTDSRVQFWVAGVGFSIVALWMGMYLFAQGGLEAIAQSYQKDLGQYFNDPEKIGIWGDNIRLAVQWFFVAIIVAMCVILFGLKKFQKTSLYMPLVPAALPLFFIIDFSAWLWFFGHNLHPWGAFTLKPFMPTVFGEGKVAQFSTYSYPHYGFLFLVLLGVLLVFSVLFRIREFRIIESRIGEGRISEGRISEGRISKDHVLQNESRED